VNKSDLIAKMTERLSGDRTTAVAAVNGVLEEIEGSVARGERVSLSGFGTFDRRERAPRTGRNPRTGEAIRVGASVVPVFRAGTGFKTLLTRADGVPMSPGSAAVEGGGPKAKVRKSRAAAPDPLRRRSWSPRTQLRTTGRRPARRQARRHGTRLQRRAVRARARRRRTRRERRRPKASADLADAPTAVARQGQRIGRSVRAGMEDSLLSGTRMGGNSVNGAPAGGPPNAGGSKGAPLAVAVLNVSGWLQLWLHSMAFVVVCRDSPSFISAGQLAY
jgi:nucleoid DNA-binding protein